jgi:ferredoxin
MLVIRSVTNSKDKGDPFKMVPFLETSTLIMTFGLRSISQSYPLSLQAFIHTTHSGQRQTTAIQSSRNDEGSDEMHTINFQTKDGAKSIEAKDGEVLRSALLKRGVSPHNANSRLINCRGLGTCGTCAVEITPTSDGGLIPIERNVKENMRLSFPPHDPASQASNLRLACQVQVCGDATVVKRNGFWGQGEDLAEEFDANLYFGDLEYILDDRSPSIEEAKKCD